MGQNFESVLQKKLKFENDITTKENATNFDLSHSFAELFEPISIGDCSIKNRIVMGPMSNGSFFDDFGQPKPSAIEYFCKRAKNNVGLVILGNVSAGFGVDPTVSNKTNFQKFACINKEKFGLKKWEELANAVHVFGAKIFIEIGAGFGRYGKPKIALKKLKLPIGASLSANFFNTSVPCKRVSQIALNKILKNFSKASRWAIEAGFDGICIDGRSVGLVEQMSNRAYNGRNFGKYAKNSQFAVDVVNATKKSFGKNIPILYKFNLSTALAQTYGEKAKKLKNINALGERTTEESFDLMKKLVDAGVDAFDFCFGSPENWWLMVPPVYMKNACHLQSALQAKKFLQENQIKTKNGKDVITMFSGKLGDPEVAKNIVSSGAADMVVLSRAFLCDECWVQKVRHGNIKDIRPCIGCNFCENKYIEEGVVECAINPEILKKFDKKEKYKSKKVAVVGAGVSGIEASLVLAKKGHFVDLYCASENVGGMLKFEQDLNKKIDYQRYLEYLKEQLKKLQNYGKIVQILGKNAQIDQIKSKNYDCVIFANGSNFDFPNINGAVLPHVFSANEALEKLKIFDNAKSVAIIGSDEHCLDLAYVLSHEKNLSVSLIENSKFAQNVSYPNRNYLLDCFSKKNVKIFDHAKVVKIEEGYVNILSNANLGATEYYAWNFDNLKRGGRAKYKAFAIDADIVALSCKKRENKSLFCEAYAKNIAPEIYCIGGAAGCESLYSSIKQAKTLANEI